MLQDVKKSEVKQFLRLYLKTISLDSSKACELMHVHFFWMNLLVKCLINFLFFLYYWI